MGIELMLLALLAFLVMGPKRMPDVARQVGRTVAELKRNAKELQTTLVEAASVPEEAISVNTPEPVTFEKLRLPEVHPRPASRATESVS